MKVSRSLRLRMWLGCAAAFGLVLLIGVVQLRSVEPVCRGHPLSEWLEAYDSSLRFDEGDGRRSRFSEAEIDQALEEIGSAALPCLRRWVVAKPSRLKSFTNRLLNRQSWVAFRFREHLDWQNLAQTGFMYYGPDAQPLLPELIELSKSRDADTRELAFQAAFFTRPPREVFLPLAERALADEGWGTRATAAQWMMELFPDEANQRGLHGKSLLKFIEQPATNDQPTSPR